MEILTEPEKTEEVDKTVKNIDKLLAPFNSDRACCENIVSFSPIVDCNTYLACNSSFIYELSINVSTTLMPLSFASFIFFLNIVVV